MSTNNKHKVSEKELDNLLGQAFLNLDFNNPKNQELMETISNQYLSPSLIPFSIRSLMLNKLVIAMACLAVATVLGIYFYPNSHPTFIENNKYVTPETVKDAMASDMRSNDKPGFVSGQKVPIAPAQKAANFITPFKNAGSVYLTDNSMAAKSDEGPIFNTMNMMASNEDTGYVYPLLTEKEIKENHRRKREMVEDLAKLSKKIYMPVPMGTFDYNGQKVSVNRFYMESTEVSNLEYLTFVFDLLIQNRKEDFLKAKPDQLQWTKVFEGTYDFTNLKDAYFSGKTYRDYPVVNISREGAEMYCRWLTNATNEYLASKNKPLMNDLRLPTNHEWTYAARSGTVTADFPWGTNVAQNSLGCFLANFHVKNFGEVKRDPKAKCKYDYPHAITTAGTILGPMQTTVLIASYNPNDFGLYCMSGNVAEMVYEENLVTKTKTHGTRGGSWYSDQEYLKLTNETEFRDVTKPSPMIGFRPVFSVSKPQFFGSIERDQSENALILNSEEMANTLKEKKKMIDALVKLNKDKYAYIPMGSFPYKKDMFSVQSFYMETTEVTNLEYRTFLADLLIQQRNEDYQTAKPDQQMWITKFPWSFNEPMRDLYFSYPAYDEYPVVNISRKGALLYCDWLTREANKVLKEAGKPLMNDLRIPVDHEWACAARQYDSTAKYANGHKFLRDSKGRYEVNYMCHSKEQCKYDSVLKMYVPKNKEELKETNTQSPKLINDGGFHTVYGRSYAPNKFGLYCMGGNVSEMVNTFDKTTYKSARTGTKGGNWFSCDYFLEIDADDEYPNEIGASPLIGFRPVFTAPKPIK
ncbi:MAG: SUMF1/EgtB/PvdO family nonheme iron enzyme [Bacteroidota bacterium]